MDAYAISDQLWRHALAVLFALLGLAFIWRGLGRAGHSLLGRGGGVVGFLEGFRLVVAGLALVGLAAAWAWQSPLLLFLALGIGFVELLESSALIAAMRRDGGRVTTNPA